HVGVSDAHKKVCHKPGKTPLVKWEAYQDRLPRSAEVKLWWNRWPGFQVGVAMGPVSRLVSVDVDGPEGELLLHKAAGGKANIPETLAFYTPGHQGSYRLLFALADGIELPKIKSFKNEAGKEILKILSKGSQTVMPPSRHANGGEYVWMVECRPGEIE